MAQSFDDRETSLGDHGVASALRRFEDQALRDFDEA